MDKINKTSVAEIALGVFIALAAMQALGWAIDRFTDRGDYDEDYDEFEEDEYYEDPDEIV